MADFLWEFFEKLAERPHWANTPVTAVGAWIPSGSGTKCGRQLPTPREPLWCSNMFMCQNSYKMPKLKHKSNRKYLTTLLTTSTSPCVEWTTLFYMRRTSISTVFSADFRPLLNHNLAVFWPLFHCFSIRRGGYNVGHSLGTKFIKKITKKWGREVVDNIPLISRHGGCNAGHFIGMIPNSLKNEVERSSLSSQ